ncbi:ATP-binding protein [Bacteroides rodentium]
MKLKREITAALLRWKESEERKPLIIQGARQIGKTWIMKEFGKLYYEHTAYFNFDASEELCREFENTKEPSRLLGILKLYTEQPIEPGKTLIIFDEIQQSNKALNSLKYFCEDAPEYHVIAAGSLLGVSLSHGDSFPVGKVDFLKMYPVSFKEFLYADNKRMYDYVEQLTAVEPLPEIVMGNLSESYRRYQVCGGMPAAATALLEGKGTEAVESIQKAILSAYALDFAKHAPGKDIPRITAIWQSIPSQLARENRKFLYKLVKNGARAREYEDGLLWLQHAGLIYRISCSSNPGLPLSAYDDLSAFKIYLCDVELLRALAQLPAEALWTDNPLYREFKGATTENTVLQALVNQFDVTPRYWASAGTAEVDFLLQYGLHLLPVEVKAGTSLNGKSLGIYCKQFDPPFAVRYSMSNLRRDDKLLNIPLFLADWTKTLLEKEELRTCNVKK